MSLLDKFVGTHVIARSSQSGVWFGTLVAFDGHDVHLSDARRIWSWEGAGSCSGLAARGPKSGRIAPAVDAVVHGTCEVLRATPEAIERIGSIAEWTP